MYVVAGVTGHVGSVVADELLSHGQKVKVLVREQAKGQEWMGKGAEVAVASLEDSKALAAALKGAKGFFTLLPPNYQASNFHAHQRKTADAIAQAVKESGVPHVVMLSSVGADLAEGNGPIKGLHHLENALRKTGTKLTAIRAGYFQENAGGVLGVAKEQGIFPNMTPSADYPFPMIATRDIGLLAANELLLPAPKSDVVDLAGPAYSTRQVAEKLGQALGKQLKVVDVPAQAHVETYKKAGMNQELAEAFAEMLAGFASGKIQPKGDRTKLGQTPIDETIATMVSGAKKHTPRPVHFEIQAENPERAIAFYKAVFGWEFNRWGGGEDRYWLIKTGENTQMGINGGLLPRNGPAPKDGEGVNSFTNTMGVPNLDEFSARATKAGGKIVVPKSAVPTIGWLAYFKDTEGNLFGMIQPDPSAK